VKDLAESHDVGGAVAEQQRQAAAAGVVLADHPRSQQLARQKAPALMNTACAEQEGDGRLQSP
jgi:hypothetical protein